MRDPLLNGSTQDAPASCGCYLGRRRRRAQPTFTEVILAAEMAGVDPERRSSPHKNSVSESHVAIGRTAVAPPQSSPSTAPITARVGSFRSSRTSTLTTEDHGDQYDQIVSEGAAAEGDTTDYASLSLKALQAKCQELNLEYRDAGSKKVCAGGGGEPGGGAE